MWLAMLAMFPPALEESSASLSRSTSDAAEERELHKDKAEQQQLLPMALQAVGIYTAGTRVNPQS